MPTSMTAALASESTKKPRNSLPKRKIAAVSASAIVEDIREAALTPLPIRSYFPAPIFCAVKAERALPTLSIGSIAMLSIFVAAV